MPLVVHAADSGVAPYKEFYKKIQAAQSVSPLTDSVFGDSVDLYTGSTSFQATDVSLPGNDALPVAVGRRLVVEDRTYDPGNLGGFGDWDLDVPWISGTFVAEDGWAVATTGNPEDRCSAQAAPDTYSSAAGGQLWLPHVWSGDQLHIPGDGTETLLLNNQAKSKAYASRSTYPWVTKGHYKVGCTTSLANGYPGEGFIAVSPSGVTYTFNWMIVHTAPELKEPWTGAVNGYRYFARSHIFLVATEVQDRFGNWVKYAWSGDHLTGITSSDGRSITLNWLGSTISSVTSAAGTLTYHYGTASGTDGNGTPYSWTYLSSVTRPDGSAWTYAYDGGMYLTPAPSDDLLPNKYGCQALIAPEPSGGFGYSIGAPSGASASFQFTYALHRRNLVPKACTGTKAYPNPPRNTNYPMQYSFFENFTIVSKTIIGPGLPPGMTWAYDYSGLEGRTGYVTASQPWNYDDVTQPYIPISVTCTGCTVSGDLVVTGPTTITRYSFGDDYASNEGQLLEKQFEDLSGNPLKTTTYTYVSDVQAPSESFPDIVGQDLLPNYISPMGNRNRPVATTTIVQDGATFTTAINAFDAFARGTSETETGVLGNQTYSKTDTTSYADDLNRWVLGMVTQSATNGIVSGQTNYDSLDRPTSHYAFGKLTSTKVWNADGTLASVTDGNGHTTSFANWYRGLPQNVSFADGTGESATVSAAGWLTSVTDQNGITTNYAYDPMGRLASITYPTGDDVAWAPTLLSFTQVNGSEYGIPAGHWKQTIHTGNGYAVTWFDAMWRPLLSEHYDSSNEAGTLSQVVHHYDAMGRSIFTSYPANNISDYAATGPGVHTAYDALGRVTEVDQDSELGPLKTTTAYLSGFQTQTTDPRGNSTLTSYQAYGAPTTKFPDSVTAPNGELTVILRDAFDKPLSITRTGTAQGSLQLTRYYVYDSHQQLCKRVDPESGATAFGYDAAGNLAWSAAGLTSLTGSTTCDASAALASGRVVNRTYDALNRVTSLTFPDGNGNQAWTYTPDGQPSTITRQNDNGGITNVLVTNSYLYDQRGLLISEALTQNNTTWTVGYGHDANGHLAGETYPNGLTIPFAPNALGQPTQVGSYATGVSYYPDGKVQQFTYGNGIVHTLTENARGLLTCPQLPCHG